MLLTTSLYGFLYLKRSCVLEGTVLPFVITKYLFSVCTTNNCLSGEYAYFVKEGGGSIYGNGM